MIAKELGQDPRAVAEWEPEWIAAVSTVLGAKADADNERRLRAERQAKRRGGGR